MIQLDQSYKQKKAYETYKMTNTKNDDHGDLVYVFKETDDRPEFTLNGESSQQKTEERRQIKNKKRKTGRARSNSMRTMILHFLWSSRRTFVLNAILCNISILLFLISSLVLDEASCDDDPIQYQRPDLFEKPQIQQPGLEPDYERLQQRQARQLDLAALLGHRMPQQPTPIADANYPLDQAGRSSSTDYFSSMSNMIDQYNNQQAIDQESRQTHGYQPNNGDADLLETAQTKAETNLVSSTNDNSEKSSAGASISSPSSPVSSSAAVSSSPSPLSEQLSVVSNLIQQAGQLGLSAAQQNVALSEAIINGVTNTLIRNNQNRKQSTPTPTVSSSSIHLNRPGHVVGQSIDGNIEYDSNSNTINGNIDFPFNFNGKPNISSAVKPILLAGLKVVPLKLGTIGWKLLQLLAWKKIYKTHHPKSGEIIIEQEMGKHNHGMPDKSSKLGNKLSQHFSNKLKTSKMGQSYASDDWMSIMKSTGGMQGGDIFSSGGWPQSGNDSPSASASMIYQRHLLPPNFSASAGQPAAAAAAAAAATAAAIQSHWMQQQQQSLMSEEGSATAESQQSRANTTGLAAGSAPNALKRKKASFAGGNWYAATPAQAYVAAAAAANAAANLATSQQQQQHHHQRMTHLMRVLEMGANPEYMQMLANGPNIYASGASGLTYHQSLFDNAAAMAVQNAVKLPPTDLSHPLTSAEFMDQSDSLSGSSFGSPFSSMTNSINDQAEPMTLMQRHDSSSHRINPTPSGTQNFWSAHSPGFRSSTDSLLYESPRNNQKLDSILYGITDFDDTPAGKLLNNAMNESASYPDYRIAQNYERFDK